MMYPSVPRRVRCLPLYVPVLVALLVQSKNSNALFPKSLRTGHHPLHVLISPWRWPILPVHKYLKH